MCWRVMSFFYLRVAIYLRGGSAPLDLFSASQQASPHYRHPTTWSTMEDQREIGDFVTLINHDSVYQVYEHQIASHLWNIPGWWFGTFISSHIFRIIIPIDELIFFRGVAIPPTRSIDYP